MNDVFVTDLESGSKSLLMTDCLPGMENLFIYDRSKKMNSGELFWKKPMPSFMVPIKH